MDAQAFREFATDAIGYWEPRRPAYNVLLAVVVVGCFLAGYPASKDFLSIDVALRLVLLAVLANVAYCSAYVVDIFAQLSGYRERWQKYRWVVLGTGIVFAGIITRFFALGMFLPQHFRHT
jgi:hypothetical protein